MVRIDMSEFMEKHSVSRLIGAPPGYVGYEEGGYLTEAVRRRPYSVILLDEVEKAHHDVFNVLLQVLDDGRLTDGQGRTVDFRNTVIVMTSNLGSQLIQELHGDTEEEYTEMKAAVMGVVQAHFRPEFINRLDEIVVFRPLDKAQIRQIARIQTDYLAKRLGERQLSMTLSEKALDLLGNVGFDPVLRRAAAQACDPAATRESAGAGDPRRQVPARRCDQGRCPNTDGSSSRRSERRKPRRQQSPARSAGFFLRHPARFSSGCHIAGAANTPYPCPNTHVGTCMTVAVGSNHALPGAVAASLRREAELHPQQPRIWLALADALDEAGDRTAAEGAYLRHVQLAVHDTELMAAASALQANRIPEAETRLQARLRQAPTDVVAIRMLAELAMRLDRSEDAENLLARCLELAPAFDAATAQLRDRPASREQAAGGARRTRSPAGR